MDSEEYELVRQLFHELGDLPADQLSERLGQLELSEEAWAELKFFLGDRTARLPIFQEEHMGAAGAFASQLARQEPVLPEAPPSIAGYAIDGVLGRGGMGIVYRGVQESPRREVAVKVLQGFALATERRRFEYEAEILARLDHPYVAKVIEAGVDSKLDELPYIVMELVDGVDLIQYADGAHLDVRQCCELFIRVCEGVQHAHQHGVVHRDLKPANILVSGDGRPRLLDFGIARPFDLESTHEVSTPGRTVSGSILGSLAWMSPEQASGKVRQTDVRSDVYSLGVIFYRLISGKMPYEIQGLPPWEAAQQIVEVEPARLAAELRGDLEAITTMALDKDPARRYRSAGALAVDLRRFLDLQPVEARPWSGTYQLRKFARRHRLLVSVVLGLVLSIVAGLGTSLVLWQRSIDAKSVAVAEAETSQRVIDFLLAMFESQAPGEARGKTVTVKEVLDRQAPRISERLEGEPLVRARLMQAMGVLYFHLGLLDESRPLLSQAWSIRRENLGPDHPDTLASSRAVLLLELERGETEGMEEWAGNLVEKRRGILGEQHPATLESLLDLGDLYNDLSRYDEAEAALQEALASYRSMESGSGNRTSDALLLLGRLQMSQGQYQAAEASFREGLGFAESTWGEDHPRSIRLLQMLAVQLSEVGRMEEAEPLARRAIANSQVVWGPDNAAALDSKMALVGILSSVGRHDEAIELNLEVVERLEYLQGPHHRATLEARTQLGYCLGRVQRNEEALDAFYLVLDGYQELGPGHRDKVLSVSSAIASMLDRTGESQEAREILMEVYDEQVELLGPGHFHTLATLNSWATLELRIRKISDEGRMAASVGRKMAVEQLGPKHPLALELRLRSLQMGLGTYEEIQDEADSIEADARDVLGEENSTYQSYLSALKNIRASVPKAERRPRGN